MRFRTTLVRDLSVRDVCSAASSVSLRECAQMMRARHVGSVVLLDPKNGHPIGIVTDRDIVVEAVATGLDASVITAGDIVAAPVVTVRDEDDIQEAIARMRESGVRRLPVVAADGRLVGVVSFDNVIEELVDQLGSLARVLRSERTKEQVTRP